MICVCEVLEGLWNVREGLGAWVGFSDWGVLWYEEGDDYACTRKMMCAEEYEKGNMDTKVMIHCGDAYIQSMFQNLERGEMARIVESCVFT
jgi:hypothetical protein